MTERYGTPLRSIAGRDVGAWTRLKRQVAVHALPMFAPARLALFEENRLLRQAIARIDGASCFSFAVHYAVAILGDELKVEIDPADCELRLSDWVGCGDRRLNLSDFFLGSGNWGEIASPIRASFVYREALELVEHGMNYRQTRAYEHYVVCARVGAAISRNYVKLDRVELVDAYFERFVKLFESIERHGVLPLEDSRVRARHLVGSSHVRKRVSVRLERDIGVAIGPRGELYRLPGGQHRTAIAMVTGVRSLPVQVRLVHIDWLNSVYPDSSCLTVEGLAGCIQSHGLLRRAVNAGL